MQTCSCRTRDAIGNAVGGIRLPDIEAPTATHQGASPSGETPNLFGRSTLLTPEVRRSLHPNVRSYRDRFSRAVRAGVDAGFLLPRHAERLLHDVEGVNPLA